MKNRNKNNNFFHIRNSSLGFTLIELLVVIAIIGILSAFITANFSGVRQKGRDAQRKQNLSQIRSALEFYRSDQGGYPPSLTNCPVGGPNYLGSSACNITYLNPIPKDPLNSGSFVFSYSSGSTSQYTLTACLENTQDSERDATNNLSVCSGTSWSYTLRNP